MRFFRCLLPALATLSVSFVSGPAPSAAPDDARLRASVVKIFVQSNPPDPLSPWQSLGIESSTGSGVILDGRRILTNAHVVADAVHILVKRAGTARRFPAEVDRIGHECDLALLSVPDPSFFEGAAPVPVGGVPKPQEEIRVFGFPLGGESVSVTSGIVSRVEVNTYSHSMEDLLMARIDAPVNPGDSGGPVVAEGRLVGIAVEILGDAENVGYMVPAPVIRHFLEDVADGQVDGIPDLGIDRQHLESAAHRESLGMRPDETGILVVRIDHGSSADGVLEPGDVLLAIDGLPISNEATVEWPGIGRIELDHAYRSKQVGESVTVTVLRAGERLSREMELKRTIELVPGRRTADRPSYLIFGGLVFRRLTYEYLLLFDKLPIHLTDRALFHNTVTPEREQLIVLTHVLPDPVNLGYQEWEEMVVADVNGIVPRNLAHLAEILDGADGRWLRIGIDSGARLVLDLAAARAARERILAAYGIPADRSPATNGPGVSLRVRGTRRAGWPGPAARHRERSRCPASACRSGSCRPASTPAGRRSGWCRDAPGSARR